MLTQSRNSQCLVYTKVALLFYLEITKEEYLPYVNKKFLLLNTAKFTIPNKKWGQTNNKYRCRVVKKFFFCSTQFFRIKNFENRSLHFLTHAAPPKRFLANIISIKAVARNVHRVGLIQDHYWLLPASAWLCATLRVRPL